MQKWRRHLVRWVVQRTDGCALMNVARSGAVLPALGLKPTPEAAKPARNASARASRFTVLPTNCPSNIFAAPTMVKRLIGTPAFADAQHRRLKCVVYGGAPMYVEDCKAAFAVLGPRLAQIYGQGEAPMTITAMDRALLADALTREDESRVASVGLAQTGIEIRIGDFDEA